MPREEACQFQSALGAAAVQNLGLRGPTRRQKGPDKAAICVRGRMGCGADLSAVLGPNWWLV